MMNQLTRRYGIFTAVCYLLSTIILQQAQAEPQISPPSATKPHIRVGLPDYSFPPFSYIGEGTLQPAQTTAHPSGHRQIDGLLIDVLDQVAKQADFTYEIILYPTFGDMINAFKAKELDLLPSVTSTFSRQQYMAFSEPVFSLRRAVITQKHMVNQFQELKGKIIAIEQGFALQELLPSLIQDISILSVTGSRHALEAVKTGKADGYIGNAVALSGLLRQQNDDDFELSILPGLPTSHVHFATQQGKHKLLSRINFALEDIKANSLKAIYNQWLSPAQINMFTYHGHLRLTPEERNWLDKHPYITIGVNRDWAPYDYLNDNRAHSGLTSDLLNIFSNELGVKFNTISHRQFSDTYQEFLDGNIMMLAAQRQTPSQEKLMYFSAPYVNEPWVLFAPSEEGMDTLFDNSGLTVGIIAGTSGSELLPKLCRNCTSVSYINQVSAFQALQKDEVDRVLTSLHHASPLLQSDYIGQFRMVGKIENNNLLPMRFAINFRHPILLTILNKAIDSLPQEELRRLENKWLTFEYQEGLAPRDVAKWAGIITLLTLMVIITIICWNRKMAEEIQQRQTAETRAKHAEKRLQHLADNLDGVVLQHIQPDPRQPFNISFSFVSAGVKELLGISPSTIKKHPEALLSLLNKPDMAELEQSLSQAIARGHWYSEQQIKSRRGELKWVQFKSHITPRDEGGYYWNTVATDISLLKEQQLALDHARQKAEVATAAKSQFLATISHEIRTPISGILGLLELMADQPLNGELVSLHGGLTQSARNMLSIVNDVLDYSKIEAGKLELHPTNIELGRILDRVIQPQSIHAQQKKLAFEYWQDPALAECHFADDIRIQQILNNFLNNAIKFTEQGTISLTVDVLENSATQQTIQFTVTDTGIGISPEQQQSLFRPFEQVDQTTSRRFGGTGLGLSIAQRLIKQMNGKISLNSQLGKGSQFSFIVALPFADSAREQGAMLPVRGPAAPFPGDGKCLIIGYFIQREELCRYLRHWELAPLLQTVEHPQLLIDQVKKHQPSHIFIAMAIWQQLNLDNSWLNEHLPDTKIVIINQNPMLSPEPIGQQWCLSVNPLLPGNLRHVLTNPVQKATTEHTGIATTYNLTESRESAEANGRLLLVAEDHPINQQVIAKQLEKIGFHADIVDNGIQALEAIKQHHYGLLLTDCHMPEMDGYTLSATIRQQEKNAIGAENSNSLTTDKLTAQFGPTITCSCKQQHAQPAIRGSAFTGLPIIALTANAFQGENNHCFEMGMSDILVKPVSSSKLKEVLWKWLKPDWPEQAESPKPENPHSSTEFVELFRTIDQQLANQSKQDDPQHTLPQPTSAKAQTLSADRQRPASVLNEQQILMLFEDKESVTRLIAEFRHNHRQDLKQLEQAVAANNQIQISTLAHRMKGAARMLDCEVLASPLDEIEIAASQQRFQAGSPAYSSLLKISEQLLEEETDSCA